MNQPVDSPAWQAAADQWDINVLLILEARDHAADRQDALGFCRSANWRPVYMDETALVLLRNTPANRPWLDRLPEGARLALLEQDRDRFRQELHLASLFAPGLESRLRRSARSFDGTASSLYELFRRIHGCRLEGRHGDLVTPTAVCELVDGQAWAGQAAETARLLGSATRLIVGRTGDDAVVRWLDELF